MDIQHKSAMGTLSATDDAFPGTFEMVLSTGTKDLDGEELLPDEWEQPLPNHIPINIDHDMSVEKVVCSGVPTLEDDQLIVRGTWAAHDEAQKMRGLVKDGHVRSTSVEFFRKTSPSETKGTKPTVKRELFGGGIVYLPANKEAMFTDAKGVQPSDSDSAVSSAAPSAVDTKTAEEIALQVKQLDIELALINLIGG